MVVMQLRSKRKPTGGRYKNTLTKRVAQSGNHPILTKLHERKVKIVSVRGNSDKVKVQSTTKANVYESKTKKYKSAKITNIVENPANRHYVRRNIMTKGTVLETDIGKAKVTSRPGQDGTVNAVLI